MYWVGTHHATNNEQGNYEEPYPCECKQYKTQRGALTVTYTKGQEECGGNTAGFHLQFYVEFEKKAKLSTLKNVFSKRIHWEVRKGTSEQAADYCGKEDTRVHGGIIWEDGERSKVKKGSRTDLESVREMMLSGKKRKDIAGEHFATFVRYYRGLEAAATALGVKLDDDVDEFHERECYIFYGTAGSGKTLSAKRLMFGDSIYVPQKTAGGIYTFESYMGERWIFLDEFAPKCMDCETLKQIMDTGRCVLPARGTGNSKPGLHCGVVITTNLDPETWYDKPVHWAAISRRCKQVWICGDPDKGEDGIEDPWMIIGGTEFPKGHRVDSELQNLKAWADETKAKIRRVGAGPEMMEQAAPSQASSQESIDLTQDED
nr:MAG: putative replication-associated protein [scracolig virus 1]